MAYDPNGKGIFDEDYDYDDDGAALQNSSKAGSGSGSGSGNSSSSSSYPMRSVVGVGGAEGSVGRLDLLEAPGGQPPSAEADDALGLPSDGEDRKFTSKEKGKEKREEEEVVVDSSSSSSTRDLFIPSFICLFSCR